MPEPEFRNFCTLCDFSTEDDEEIDLHIEAHRESTRGDAVGYERSDFPDVDATGNCYSDADPGL